MVKRKYEHITKLDEGLYQIRFAYLDPETGEPKRIKRRVSGTLQDALLERERLLDIAKGGGLAEDKGRHATVRGYYADYLEHMQTRRKPATKATIENIKSSWRNRIEPYYGDWVVLDIRRSDLTGLIKTWEKLKKDDGSYFAANSIMTWRDVLTPFLMWIFEKVGRKDTHILQRLTVVSTDPHQEAGRALSAEEARKLLEYLYENRPFWYTFVLISLLTGQRFGSVSALRWDDVTSDQIRFRQSQYRGATKAGSKTGKIITLPMLPSLWTALEAHRDYLEAIDHPHRDLGILFPGYEDGVQQGYLTSDKLRLILRTACKRLDLPKITPHDLRRSANTWLIDAGVAGPLVREIVGHSNAALTERYYRGSQDARREALAHLGEMLTFGNSKG